MHDSTASRILVIDDNATIHNDFRLVLEDGDENDDDLVNEESLLFGTAVENKPPAQRYELEFASQGEDGVALLRKRLREGKPFDCAFVDIRMPPGIDGVETTVRIWEFDDVPVVLCSAYSDYSWHDIFRHLGKSDGLFILKKPFEAIEVRQLAMALTERRRKERLQRRQVKTDDAVSARPPDWWKSG